MFKPSSPSSFLINHNHFMDTIGNYKNRALASLDSNWGKAVCCTLVYMILSYVAQQMFLSFYNVHTQEYNFTVFVPLGGIFTLLLFPMAWSFQTLFLDIVRGQKASVENLFDGYKDGKFVKTFCLGLLVSIFVFLWSLLLIVPGIIKSYSYSMSPYILKENPDMDAMEAINESMRLMDGHKMKLFLLDLSMIGWAILCCITCGIGTLFLTPYVYSCHAHFYEDLKKENM
jgi:uncharacterized membrane protein